MNISLKTAISKNLMAEANISSINKRSTRILLTGILIALVYYKVFGFLIFHWLDDTVVTTDLNYLLISSEVGVLYLYARTVEDEPFLRWRESRHKVLFWVASIIILFVLEGVAKIIANIPRRLSPHKLQDFHLTNAEIRLTIDWCQQNLILLIFFWAIWVAATELIFRGFLLPRLVVLFKNNAVAVIGSSLCFALFPFVQHDWAWTIENFITGVVMALFYLKYRNMSIVIIARILFYVTGMCALRSSVLVGYLLRLH